MKAYKSLIVLSFFIVSCASIHKGNYAKQVKKKKDQDSESRDSASNKRKMSSSWGNETDAGLVISYEWNTKFNDKHFKYLDFTFENKSSKWKKVEKVGLKFLDGNVEKNIFFLKGAPLAAFLQGKELKLKVQAENQAAWLGAIAATAASARTSSSHADYRNYNQGLVTIALATSISKNAEAREKQQNAYPEDHLFGSKERFLIPPGLALTKYLVFYSENPKFFKDLKTVQVTYFLKDGESETVELDVESNHYY